MDERRVAERGGTIGRGQSMEWRGTGRDREAMTVRTGSRLVVGMKTCCMKACCTVQLLRYLKLHSVN